MRPAGDFPLEDLVLIDELVEMERMFEEHKEDFSKEHSAMGLTAMSHDYFFIFLEEEGERLLRKAERLCPGYFAGPIHPHIERNPDFGLLVSNLQGMSEAHDLMKSLGFKK